jgi:dTDP-4-amino-4,6-dideoxygalactose transaminase
MKIKYPLFYPNIHKKEWIKELEDTFSTRWIGEGPKVKKYEKEFGKFIGAKYPVTVNSCTSALHLAYILAGIKEGDEVITPVFSCLFREENILMADGSYKRICDLVNRKSNEMVVSFNEKTKKFENKKIINWYKNSSKGREWYKISFKNSIGNGYNGKRGVQLTNDHKVLTNRGYVQVDDIKENDKIFTSYYDLNDKQMEVFIGTMLGDGFIRFGRKENTGCRFGFSHSIKQREWLDLKINSFNGLNNKIFSKLPYKQTGEVIGTIFNMSPIWNIYRKDWYKNRKKIIPEGILYKYFSPLSLATWYMDDGSLQTNKIPKTFSYSIILCSEGFTKEENIILINLLKKRFSINASLQKVNKNNKEKYRIYIGNGSRKIKKDEMGRFIKTKNQDEDSNINKFFRLVAPYIPESMKYKLPKYINEKIFFDKKLWNTGVSITFLDNPIIIKKKPNATISHLKSVYCIDVEDNHNFISKNIILHNCSATTHPILWQGATPVFADIKDDFTIDPKDVIRKMTSKTKAVIAVDYGGKSCDYKALLNIGLPIIADKAQSLVYSKEADYNCFSTQAVKFMNTGDGGILTTKTEKDCLKAKRFRWFGIDREKNYEEKHTRSVAGSVTENGRKYQFTDLGASLGLVNLRTIKKEMEYRQKLVDIYDNNLSNLKGLTIVNHDNSCNWLYTVLVEDRERFFKGMDKAGVEVSMAHARNDDIELFRKYKNKCPMMDYLESRYVCIPLHLNLTEKDVHDICKIIKSIYA